MPLYTDFCNLPKVSCSSGRSYTLTYTLAMVPNRNHAYTLGSPPPTFACPCCPRHFKSKSGRTRHIQVKHLDYLSEPHALDTGAHTSPIPSLNSLQPSFHNPSPDPSPSLPPSCNEFNADPNIDMDSDIEHPHPNAPHITRVFHPKLNGMSIYIYIIYTYSLTLTFLFVGEICDESGNVLPPDTPPAPHDSDKGPDDWTPYDNRLQFEVADFLFRRNQMSAGDINFLLNLWAASLATHSDEPPFSKATHLYDTIDSTPLGDAAWDSFSLQYNGTRPESNVPSWMEAEYDVWFRDPRTLVHNLLSNPDFKSGFDYAPFQERTADGCHRFQNFLSANWAWNQAVGLRSSLDFFDLY